MTQPPHASTHLRAVARQINAEDGRFPRRWRENTGEQTEEAGLPGPVGPRHHRQGTRGKRQGHATEQRKLLLDGDRVG